MNYGHAACPAVISIPSLCGQFGKCLSCGAVGADRGGDGVLGGDHGLDRLTAWQV